MLKDIYDIMTLLELLRIYTGKVGNNPPPPNIKPPPIFFLNYIMIHTPVQCAIFLLAG